MSCDGLDTINPVCQISAAATSVATDAFTHTAAFFGQAAVTATSWLWQQIDTATAVDLNSPALRKELAITGAIAGVVCLGLFVIQLITAALRREPGALGRAVKGLFISALGTAFALAATRTLLGAVDALSEGVVQHTLGTNMKGIGNQLALANVTSLTNPAVMLVMALAMLCSAVVVWFAMMIRKMLLIISAVMAPLAFAGATAEITRSWVRKWIEFVCAMAVSKLILVLILSTGISVMQGAGLAGGQTSQVGTQLAVGSLILLLGGLSPWLAMRMCTFAGDSLYAAHVSAGHATSGGRAAIAAPQKMAMVYSQGRALGATSGGSGRVSGGGMAAGMSGGRGGKQDPPGGTSSGSSGGMLTGSGSSAGTATVADPGSATVTGPASGAPPSHPQGGTGATPPAATSGGWTPQPPAGAGSGPPHGGASGTPSGASSPTPSGEHRWAPPPVTSPNRSAPPAGPPQPAAPNPRPTASAPPKAPPASAAPPKQ